MKDRASKVVGEFQLLSEDEKKVVLEKILEDSLSQANAIDVVANSMRKRVFLQQGSNNN